MRSPDQYKACSPPLLCLSTPAPSTNPLRGPRAAQPFSCIAAGCPAGLPQLTSSLLIQHFMEESCSFQLISPRKPPRNPSSIILKAVTRRPAGETQPATELNRNQQDGFTELRTAQQQLVKNSISFDLANYLDGDFDYSY